MFGIFMTSPAGPAVPAALLILPGEATRWMWQPDPETGHPPCGAPVMAMHYPRRVSRIKKKRAQGFRARMKTKSGRKIINRRRKIGRHLKFA